MNCDNQKQPDNIDVSQIKKMVGDGQSVEFRDNSDLLEGEKLKSGRCQSKALAKGKLPFWRIKINQQGSI